MSQLFEIRITACGAEDAAEDFKRFIADEWLEMSRGNGILNGFRSVPKSMPVAKSRAIDKGVHLTFDFKADGAAPQDFAIAISQRFPALRFAMMTADASEIDWLAMAIVTFRGAFACARFERESEEWQMESDFWARESAKNDEDSDEYEEDSEDFQEGDEDRRLLSFLSKQVPKLDALITDEGKIVDFDDKSAPFNALEVGILLADPADSRA